LLFFFSSRRRHTRSKRDWSSDVCSSDLPMRDGKLQGKNVFNRQELLWLQDKFPEHMKKQGFELKRGERGSDRKHIETAKFKKQTLEKEIDFLEKNLAVKKDEW